jgi:hypothetical protein
MSVAGRIVRAYGRGTVRPAWKYELRPDMRCRRSIQMGRITAQPMHWKSKAEIAVLLGVNSIHRLWCALKHTT